MRGEKNTLAAHLDVANFGPSENPATEEYNSCYSNCVFACPTAYINSNKSLKKHFTLCYSLYMPTRVKKSVFGGASTRNQSNNPFTRLTASSFFRLMILAYTCVIFTSVCPSNFEVVYKSAPSVSIIVANVCLAV